MATRAAIAILALTLVTLAYLLWKRPPGRLTRLDLPSLGIRGPAIVQFTTRYCGPCKTARPHLEAAALRTDIAYAQIDIGERPEVARRYRIRTAPTIVVAAGSGAVLGTWTELPPERELNAVARRAANGMVNR